MEDRMLHRSLAAWLFIVGVAGSVPTNALTLRFTGVVEQVNGHSASYGDPFAVGDVFTAVVSFPTNVSAPHGVNRFTVPTGTFTSQLGPWTISPGATPDFDEPGSGFPEPTVRVELYPQDGQWIIGTQTQRVPGSGIDFVAGGGRVYAEILASTVFDADWSTNLAELPLGPPLYLGAGFQVGASLQGVSGFTADGVITSVEIVPEPATALLFAAGLAAVAAARRRRALHRPLAAGLFLVGVAGSFPADALTIRFTGVVNYVENTTGIGDAPGVGEVFTAVVAFPTGVSAPNGRNFFDSPPAVLSAQLGGWTLSPGEIPSNPPRGHGPGPDPTLSVYVFDEEDSYGIATETRSVPGSGIDFAALGGIAVVDIGLQMPFQSVNSYDLTLFPTELAAMEFARFTVYYSFDQGSIEGFAESSGLITSIEVVPEPATALLLAGGLAAIAALGRRRAIG